MVLPEHSAIRHCDDEILAFAASTFCMKCPTGIVRRTAETVKSDLEHDT